MTQDFLLEYHGSICLVRPLTEQGKEWLLATAPEDAQFFGPALVVEPRYLDGVCQAIEEGGLDYGQ